VHPGHDVLVVGDTIAAVGPDLAVPDGTVEIDATGGLVMPGMIDTHRHMWQTVMRGYGADWTLTQYFVWYYLQCINRCRCGRIWLRGGGLVHPDQRPCKRNGHGHQRYGRYGSCVSADEPPCSDWPHVRQPPRRLKRQARQLSHGGHRFLTGGSGTGRAAIPSSA
jgi:hypothetical protein